MWLLTGSVLAMERLRFKNLSEFYLLNLWLCYKLTFVILSHNNIVKTLLVFQQSPIDYIKEDSLLWAERKLYFLHNCLFLYI